MVYFNGVHIKETSKISMCYLREEIIEIVCDS